MRAVILDLGYGNLASIYNAFKFLGVEPRVAKSNDPESVTSATHLILPGVGAFDAAMSIVEKRQLRPLLAQHAVVNAKPLLGVCLGMQLLFEGSAEGQQKGLGFLSGRSVALPSDPNSSLKSLHVGFSSVSGYSSQGLFDGLDDSSYFYFTHSYAIKRTNQHGNIGVFHHGEVFVGAFQIENLCGVQFHPEKSQASGLKLLRNFLRL
jgi:glutamine amidotransferase